MSCILIILINNIEGQSYGYNKIQSGITVNSGNITYISGGNFTQAQADLLYASIIWGYNQTSAGEIYNYNHTTISNDYTNAMILANTSIFISTYNDTYALYAYNQSGSGGDNSTWSEIYANQLYISSGNLSELFSTYNSTYAPYAYNHSTIVFTQISNQNASWISTYNSTYAPYAYNQTLASGWIKNTTSVYLASLTDRVGIGTTSPEGLLQVIGNQPSVYINSTGTQALLQFTSTGGRSILYQDNTLFRIFTGGTNRINIDSNGKVNIGASSPTHTLTVQGDINTTGNIYQGNAVTWWNGTCLNTNVSGVIVQSIGCT